MFVLSSLVGLMVILSNWTSVVCYMAFMCLLATSSIHNYSFYSMTEHFFFNHVTNLLMWLSILIGFLSIMSSGSDHVQSFYGLCLAITLVLILTFKSKNILFFFIFFEVSLIPTLFLIISFGYQPERFQAGTYMILYTITLSIPLLFMILWRAYETCSFSVLVLSTANASSFPNILFISLFGAFLVKLPMYGTHLWLPKAHVEAPLAGSMILAGVLLKLGGYGIYLMNLTFNILLIPASMVFFICLSMWGSFLAALVCMKQTDMKALVAYSSVAHMGLVSLGFLSGILFGYTSAMILMFAHGASSSAMFCLAYFTYKKSHSRSLLINSGLLMTQPALALFWFLFCSINMAAPGTLNLLSEILIMPAIFMFSILMLVTMGLMIFFSAVYNMYLYTATNHGVLSQGSNSSSYSSSMEKFSLMAHLMPLLMLFKSNLFLW